MEPKLNVQKIAIEIGDTIKWSSSVNEINRLGQAVFKISKETFANSDITSVRQQEIYNGFVRLVKQICLQMIGSA